MDDDIFEEKARRAYPELYDESYLAMGGPEYDRLIMIAGAIQAVISRTEYDRFFEKHKKKQWLDQIESERLFYLTPTDDLSAIWTRLCRIWEEIHTIMYHNTPKRNYEHFRKSNRDIFELLDRKVADDDDRESVASEGASGRNATKA